MHFSLLNITMRFYLAASHTGYYQGSVKYEHEYLSAGFLNVILKLNVHNSMACRLNNYTRQLCCSCHRLQLFCFEEEMICSDGYCYV